MSEYLSKKAVLEWLDDRRYKSPWIESFRERLESGAFDADESEGTWKATAEVLGRENAQMNSEIQRLRAALVEIKQLLNENRENDGAFQSWNHMQAWKVATQALSTTSEPCPTCGVIVESACPIGDCEPTSAERVREHDWVSTPVDANDLIGDLIGERCPKCGADMLGNKVGDKWCSMVGCDYDINALEKVGTKEWRHKYFGAEWPKAEGDENDA